jgi:carbon monoxide dehydrogenase subunit G
VQDEKHFTVKVNVGVSYIKGVADVTLELSEAERPSRAQYKGQGAVAGGNVTLLASFDLVPSLALNTAPSLAPNLAPKNDGTKVNWQGEAQIFGRLASVAGGLLEPLGKKQVQKLIDGLQAALG